MFFVRREDGLLPVVANGGVLLKPADFQKDIFTPSSDQLGILGVQQMKSFFQAMGYKLKVRTTKDGLVDYALQEWDETVEHGMTLTHDFDMYERISTGTKKLMLYTPEDRGFTHAGTRGVICPFMVSCGQVIPIRYFDTLEEIAPLKHQFESLPFRELRQCIYFIRGFSPSDKVSKMSAVETAMEAWEQRTTRLAQYDPAPRASNEDAPRASDEDAPRASDEDASRASDEDASDVASSSNSEDEKITKTGAEDDYDIEDYINLQDAPYFLKDEYLRDPSCFDDANAPHDKTFVYLNIIIRERQGRELFEINVPSDKYVGCLKTLIVEKVATLSSAKHRLREENFGLYIPDEEFAMSPLSTTDKLEDIADGEKEITMYLVLKLQGGGGLGVRRAIKKAKPTTGSDATSYSHVFNVAKTITENSTCDLGNLLGDMDAPALTDLRKYISTDKAHLQKKVANVASYTPQFKQIQAIIDKLEYAKEKLVDLTAECVNEQCMSEDEPLKAVLLSKIDVAIGKKQSADASAMDADLWWSTHHVASG